MYQIHECPIKTALNGFRLGNKWTLEIIRDLFYGKKYFTEFLESNEKLSKKVLAEKLKELIENKLIRKIVTHESPLKIEYQLTDMGRDLNKILYELALYGLKYQNIEIDSPAAKDLLEDLEKNLQIS